MRIAFVWLATLFLMTGLLIVGCSDDDECPACPESSSASGFVTGSIYLDPGAYLDYLWVYGQGAVPPNIDSVKVGDSLIEQDDIDYDYEEDYHDSFWEIYFYEDGDNYMYEHGDMATVTIWGEGQSSTAQVIVLDDDMAEALVTSPEYDADTISSGESVDVYWNSVEYAQYYAIFVEVRDVVNDNTTWYYKFDYAIDTTYTVTPDMLTDSVYYFYVNVTPFTGPDPRTGQSNWSGDWLDGTLYSFGESDWVRIYGWRLPPLKAGRENGPEERPRLTPPEIIDQVYRKAR